MDQQDNRLSPEERESVNGQTPPDDNGKDLPAGAVAQFGADLSREEYVRFNVIAAKTAGMLRHQRMTVILLGATMALSLMLIVSDALAGVVDPVMMVVVIFLLLAGVGLLFGLPAFVRRGAGRTYDQTLMNGYRFYGTVTVYPDRLEKRCDGETARIVYAQAAYIETADQLILMAPGAKAIVLPARCLTAEDAERLRRTVLPSIPPVRQRLLGRFVPAAARRMEPPAAGEMGEDGRTAWENAAGREEAEPLFQIAVDYTDEEFKKIAFDSALRTYTRMLPLYSGVSLFTALMFGLMSSLLTGIVLFLLLMALFFASNVLLPRSRAARMLRIAPEQNLSLYLSFSDTGIQARAPEGTGPAGASSASRIAWATVNRAVERPDSVEFYAGNQFLRVPKRCIPNLELLKELVDRHVKPKK